MTERKQHRSITERWVVTGTLMLETPAHFGNGDADALTDMPLLVDEVDGKPLLPGTSIAGALRSYLRELEANYGAPFPKAGDDAGIEKERAYLATKLFGGFRSDDEGAQSPLIVFDAPGHAAGMELRDGVKIDAETRTAEDQKKFDIQLLAAGSSFDLRFELLVSNRESQALRDALATALTGLEKGEIMLGARKRRGFGQCKVTGWQVWKYDLATKDGLLAWLASERGWQDTKHTPEKPDDSRLAAKLAAVIRESDQRKTAHLSATFTIDGTLMIRSGFGEADSGPDMVHLHSPRPKKDKPDEQEKLPIIPGTSWAGVLRHRALKISRTVSGDRQKSQEFVDSLFGSSAIERKDSKNTKASRVSIKESEIVDSTSLVVTRVKIDRFTGGAFESALFSEQPAVGKPETRVTLELTLRSPRKPEVGLLLLLLKDLWTGDLPIGGESGVGRGRLKGLIAGLSMGAETWTFISTENKGVKLETSKGASDLQTEFVDSFNKVDQWMVKHD